MRAMTNCRGGSPPDKAHHENSRVGLCAGQMNAVDVTDWKKQRAGDAEREMKMLNNRNLLIL